MAHGASDQTMKAVAVILIVTEPGMENKVIQELLTLDEVTESLLLFGEYDIFAKLICENYNYLSTAITTKIRNIPGVESTKTLTAAPMD